MKILIKFPSRSRPEKFKYALYNYVSKCKDKKRTEFLFTFDSDDETMNNEEMKQEISDLCHGIKYYIDYGTSENKIHAINRGLKETFHWNIVLLASDDMIPTVKGYDEIIREKMKATYPDLDGVLWFNDGYAEDRLNTLVIMGNKYFRRFNYIYNPNYKSFFCDNEFMDVANRLRKQTYFSQCIIRHQHPSNTADVQEDELYRQNNKYWNEDERFYYHSKAYDYDLSVLICSLAEREHLLDNLLKNLSKYIKPENFRVEILTDVDNREKSIGQKRNDLVARAKGKYCCFIDDDDEVSPEYFMEIGNALKAFPDTDSTSLVGVYYKDAIEQKRFYHSMQYKFYAEDEEGYYRPPNHLNPILTGFVKRIGFLKKNHGEDTDFAMSLSKANLIMKEVYITKPLYFYYFIKEKRYR